MNTMSIIQQSKRIVKNYLVGKTVFSIETPGDLPSPPNLELFNCDGNCQPVVEYKVKEAVFDEAFLKEVWENFSPVNEIRREDRIILQKGDWECRLIYFHGADTPYGIYLERSEREIEIWLDSAVRHMMIYDAVYLSLFGLEKQMLKQGALILHCAYIKRNGRAVLFSAPSGTGKSTQADLWAQYRGTATVNGDKALLYRHDDGWYAHGWPICGSSEICNNAAYPIEAIVIIHQAKENAIEPLGGFPLIKKLMAQVTINMWNPVFQMQAMDLIDSLAGEVPGFELGCDMSEGAVECLEKVLV